MKRGRLEMKIDMLRVVHKREVQGDRTGVTRLTYGAGLSWLNLHTLLNELVVSGLLKNTTRGVWHLYSLTDKGHDVLRRYEELSKMLDEKPATDYLKWSY